MTKEKLTQDKAKNSPAGGVVVGKRNGQTMVYDDASVGGYFVGKLHSEGGIKMINKSNGQPLEVQGSEVIITAPAVNDNKKREFEGKMMTNRQILSKINSDGGGVSFAKGGDIPKRIKRTGASYKYGGKTMTDHEIYKKITGGHLAEGMTLTQIAKKHNVSLKDLQKQVDMGMKAESEHTSSKREQMKIVKDHLFENPKYYTLLKKAGLKHGGRVHRGSLVRDAKSGNTPARDLNNYNDVLDVEADGVYGAETGLFAGGGLIAPNGNKSNLTPKQYKLVRTPEFKAWFGDWENDPENASKVVDENGEPMVVYHTTSNEFNVFSKKKSKEGFFFAPQKERLSVYNKLNINSYFLNLRNPSHEMFKFDLNYLIPKGYDGIMDYGHAKHLGNKNLYEIVAFEPNQIKLADGSNTTFDDNNPDIRYATGGSFAVSYAKGGITNVTVNNWSDVPDSLKNVRLPKQIDWSPNPNDDGLYEIVKPFLGTEPLREAMQGMNFDDNGITATNAHILLTIPTIEHDYQGVYKKEKGGSVKIDVKFPNYAQVIPKETDITKVFQFINTDKLLIYCKVASNYTKQQITFRINDEQMSFVPENIIGLITSWIKLTGLSYAFVSFQTNKRALVFSGNPTFELGKDRFALLMPNIYETGTKLGARNESKNTELNVYFDFDDNEIHNSDGSIVDLSIKPVKTRAKRTPKATVSKTIPPTSKILIKEELQQSKLWIGNDIALRDRVMQKLLEIGFYQDKDYGDRDLSTTENIHIRIYTNDFVVFGNEEKTFFDKSDVKEIFISDLGITSTPMSIEKFTAGEISAFKQIEDIVNENNFEDVRTSLWEAGDRTISFFVTNDDTGQVFKLRSYNKTLGRVSEDEDKEKSRLLILQYLDWKKSTPTSTEKFTSGEIDMFSQIDAIVDLYKIDFVDVTKWGKDFITTTTDFDIVDTLTGDVFQLRKYNLSLGVVAEDVDIEKSIALIRKYKEFKKLTPTKDAEKKADKIEVWKLYPVSEDGQHTSDFGLYSAKQLLDYLIDSYSQFPKRDFFEFKIVDQYGKTYDNVDFIKGLNNFSDLVGYIDSGKQFQDKYSWKGFNLYDAPETIVEQPKPSQTEKPKRNFELERKYLSQRISDLAKELDLKKPILSNEEVAFYQREINSFILKLRKLNDAEMSLKSIEERVRGVYGLKFASFDNEYPETDMTSINALKSQLTEKEYFNVRTPEFKSFFGDWENAYLNDSYAGVSKVINPITKEPQPVFHGTNVLFVNWKTYDTNNAHYFAVKREFSEFFATSWESRSDKAGVDSEILKKLNPNKGNFLLRCFIDVKNPIDFSRFGVEKYPIREFLTFLRVNYNIGDFDFWTNITSHSGFTQDTEVYAWQIIRLWQSFTKYVKVFTTYDGYIFYEYIPTKPYGGLENASLSYCAFDSNQIKFTDAYEFNALSNDSRFDLGGIL